MKDEKFTEITLKQKRLSYLISSVVSLLNIFLLIQTVATLWGVKVYIQKPQLTREFLLQYEIYIRYLVTIAMFLLIIDSYVYNYYKRKHGTNPPRVYGISLSFFIFITFLLAYYLYQVWTFIYFTIIAAFSLTYYLTLQNPYLEELSRSKFIKKQQ